MKRPRNFKYKKILLILRRQIDPLRVILARALLEIIFSTNLSTPPNSLNIRNKIKFIMTKIVGNRSSFILCETKFFVKLHFNAVFFEKLKKRRSRRYNRSYAIAHWDEKVRN